MRGAADGLGIRSVLHDLGHEVNIDMAADATAAVGMVKRQGLGRIRHLAVADLWVQQKISEGDLRVSKIHGKENPADLFTKVLSREHCAYLMSKLGFKLWQGRSSVAPVRFDGIQPHLWQQAAGGCKDEAVIRDKRL